MPGLGPQMNPIATRELSTGAEVVRVGVEVSDYGNRARGEVLKFLEARNQEGVGSSRQFPVAVPSRMPVEDKDVEDDRAADIESISGSSARAISLPEGGGDWGVHGKAMRIGGDRSRARRGATGQGVGWRQAEGAVFQRGEATGGSM